MEMEEIKIVVDDDVCEIYAPYNPVFYREIIKRRIGGTGAVWDPAKHCWKVSKDAEKEVRTIAEDVYGLSDITK